MAYLLEGVKSLSNIKAYDLKVESEDFSVEGSFLYGMVTNSVSVGGFKNITGKNVKLDDGEFEVTLIKKPNSAIELNHIWRHWSIVTSVRRVCTALRRRH